MALMTLMMPAGRRMISHMKNRDRWHVERRAQRPPMRNNTPYMCCLIFHGDDIDFPVKDIRMIVSGQWMIFDSISKYVQVA